MVRSTGGDWDGFAIENGSPAAMASGVVGRSLWDFVAGVDTKAFLNTVFFICRAEARTFTTTYRCDSPTERRLFRMTILPNDEMLLVGHEPIEITSPLRAPDILTPSFTEINRCSMCCAVKIEDEWVETFALAPLQDFPKSYSICPTCRSEIRRALQPASQGVVALGA
jgi:hypothetical protein